MKNAYYIFIPLILIGCSPVVSGSHSSDSRNYSQVIEPISIGMSKEEVMVRWGEPKKVKRVDDNLEFNEIWTFQHHWKFKKYLYFKNNILVKGNPNPEALVY